MELTGTMTQRQDRRATQRSESKRKIVKCLPSFTSDYCFTAENSTQIFELPGQASNIQHFLLGKQQQFQAKHAKFSGGGVKGQVFFQFSGLFKQQSGWSRVPAIQWLVACCFTKEQLW